MSERLIKSPSFWPRQGLIDSLSSVFGGDAKVITDPGEDPFFIFEAWLVPEFSQLAQCSAMPDEAELQDRLKQAPSRILNLVEEGLLTPEGCEQVFQENGLTLADAIPEVMLITGSRDNSLDLGALTLQDLTGQLFQSESTPDLFNASM